MPFAVAALSHTPMFGRIDPGGSMLEEVNAAIGRVRGFIETFDPEVIVSFGPDHLNGVLYEMMPSFAIGAQAEGVGDWGTRRGPLPVDAGTARLLHAEVLGRDIDVARSERLKVDHGMLQSLELIFGAGLPRPFVPVFVNSIGKPLGPMRRVRLFGEALGAAAATLGKRVLFTASGGLSHDPPVADFETGTPEVRERITHADITPEQIAQREAAVLAAGKRRAAGEGPAKLANEPWDREVLRVLASGDLSQADAWTSDWVLEGGAGAHEIRAWLAAYAALSAGGRYETVEENYWASRPWGCGFGIVTVQSVP